MEEKFKFIEKNCIDKVYDERGIVLQRPQLNDEQKGILSRMFVEPYVVERHKRACGVTSALVWYIIYQIYNSDCNRDILVALPNSSLRQDFKEKVKENLDKIGKAEYKFIADKVLLAKYNEHSQTIRFVSHPDSIRGLKPTEIIVDGHLYINKELKLRLDSLYDSSEYGNKYFSFSTVEGLDCTINF